MNDFRSVRRGDHIQQRLWLTVLIEALHSENAWSFYFGPTEMLPQNATDSPNLPAGAGLKGLKGL